MEGNPTANNISSINVQCNGYLVFTDSKCFVFVRDCDFNKCALPAVPNQVTTWTLTAKNPLGVKTITDTADPAHRGMTNYLF